MQIRLFGKTITAGLGGWKHEDERARLTLRLFDGEDDGNTEALLEARVSLHTGTRLTLASFDIEPGGDSPFHGALSVLGYYLGWRVDGRPAYRLAKQAVAMIPGDMGSAYSGRTLRVSVHDTAFWWQILVDDNGWTSKRPKWRDGNWHPLGHRRVQSTKVLEEREVVVPLPERSYRAKAVLEECAWGWEKLPRRFDETIRRVKIDMLEGEQVPTPGKGENSWDCDEDATYGMTCPARTIEDGIGEMVASTLRRRMRYGGQGWQPEAKAAS